jgi:mannose-6-phosphate isomerase
MTDYSIILEWAGFPLSRDDAFLGLAADVALRSVRLDAVSSDGLDALRGECIRSLATGQPGRTSLLPPSAADFFAAEQIITGGDPISLEPRFAILVVNDGEGTLLCNAAAPIPVSAGQVYLLPYAAGTTQLQGRLSAVRCYPA